MSTTKIKVTKSEYTYSVSSGWLIANSDILQATIDWWEVTENKDIIQ